MINLKLLASIDKQPRKEKKPNVPSTTLFGGLPLIVLMGDFYHIAPVVGKALWDESHKEKKIHEKTMWNCFSSLLTLTEQIQQKADPAFPELLKRARQGKLNIRDIEILNKRVTTSFLDTETLETVVVVQKNKSRHLINRMQIERLAQAINQTIIIFPAENYRLKKDRVNHVQLELLFEA